MKKVLFILLMILSASAWSQTTLVNKLRASGFIKKNNYTRVLVQDSINGDVNWVLKNSIAPIPTIEQVLGAGSVAHEKSITIWEDFAETGTKAELYPAMIASGDSTGDNKSALSVGKVTVRTGNAGTVSIDAENATGNYNVKYPAKTGDHEPVRHLTAPIRTSRATALPLNPAIFSL